MGSILDQFDRLTNLQKFFLFLVVNLLLVFLFYFFLYSPKEEKIKNYRNELQIEQTKLAESKAIAQNITQFREEVARLNVELQEALKSLPNKSEIPELLKRVSNLGTKVGLEFTVFRPANEIFKNFYAEIPVDIEVIGGYHEIAQFFDSVGKLQRIVNVKNIVMGNPTIKSNKILLKAKVLAITFRFVEDWEIREMEESRKKAVRK